MIISEVDVNLGQLAAFQNIIYDTDMTRIQHLTLAADRTENTECFMQLLYDEEHEDGRIQCGVSHTALIRCGLISLWLQSFKPAFHSEEQFLYNELLSTSVSIN